MGAWGWKVLFFQSTWKKEYSKSISELYTEDNKSKHSSNPTDILKCASKSSMKNFIPQRLLPKLPLLNLLAKLLIERKYLMNNFIFVRLKFSKWGHNIYKFSNK